MGTTAPIKRVITEPKRAGVPNPYVAVPAPVAPVPEPERVPATPAGTPAGRR
jgi:hypothetical protein